MTDGDTLRVDKWLWYARFCKTRSMATRFCKSGRIRLNKVIVNKPHAQLRPGDVLTFALGPRVRVIRVRALGSRRGPATEARMLYDDLSPPHGGGAADARHGRRPAGTGRPTKRDRREVDRLRGDA
ncbi:MAG: RNA-binding S4 domain-containing protein [Alphaproteobacteria bacterium]